MTRVRDLEQKDRAAWQELYAGYGEFYKTPLGPEKADRVWAWLMDPGYEAFGLVAVDDDDSPVFRHRREQCGDFPGIVGREPGAE